VFLGWTCGIFAAILVAKVWEAFVHRRTQSPED